MAGPSPPSSWPACRRARIVHAISARTHCHDIWANRRVPLATRARTRTSPPSSWPACSRARIVHAPVATTSGQTGACLWRPGPGSRHLGLGQLHEQPGADPCEFYASSWRHASGSWLARRFIATTSGKPGCAPLTTNSQVPIRANSARPPGAARTVRAARAQTHCHDVRKTRHIKNQPPEPPQDGRVHLYVCVRNGGTCSWFGRIQISISNVYLRTDYLCIVCCLCVDLYFECTERRHGVIWAQCCFSITIVQSANAVVGLFGVGCGMALFGIGLRKLVPNGVQLPSSLACCMSWCLRLYLCLWLCSCLSLGP